MVSEKDIEYQELGPGKGALLILSGETAKQVVQKADELKVNASEMVQALIQAYVEGEIKLEEKEGQ